MKTSIEYNVWDAGTYNHIDPVYIVQSYRMTPAGEMLDLEPIAENILTDEQVEELNLEPGVDTWYTAETAPEWLKELN